MYALELTNCNSVLNLCGFTIILHCFTYFSVTVYICTGAFVKRNFNSARMIVSNKSVVMEIETDACSGSDTEVNYLEHVQAVITLNSTRRGDIELFLTSPMGTKWVTKQSRYNPGTCCKLLSACVSFHSFLIDWSHHASSSDNATVLHPLLSSQPGVVHGGTKESPLFSLLLA